jgi:hypothetical protein
VEQKMKNQDEISDKETLRKEKVKAEEARLLAKQEAKTRAYQAREREIEKGQKIKETQRSKDLADEEAREIAKEKNRKESYLAREKKIAEDMETRKSKNPKSA